MIADIIFLNVPYAYSSRQIPVGDAISEDWVITTISNVKCSEDLTQSISVPTFDDYSEANMVKINTNYYFIGSYTTKTYQEEVVTFEIVYNAITTNLTTTSVLTGVFERTPTDSGEPVTPITIQSDNLQWTREVKLPRVPLGGSRRAYVYTVTSVEAGNLNIYMGFCEGVNTPIDLYNNGVSRRYTFPTIDQIINDPDSTMGILADSITNISVSERCHLPLTWVGNSTINVTGDSELSQAPFSNKLFKQTGANDTMGYVLYKVIPGASIQEKSTLILTEKERHCASISIVDNSYNKVASFKPYSSIIDIFTETVVDYYGIYTQVCLGSAEGKNGIIRFNEGKLPWVGDNWVNYTARSMDTDRRELEMNITNARDQRNIDMMEGAANAIGTGVIGAVATGNPLGAVAGIAQFAGSAVAANAKGNLADKAARQTLEISQARVKDSATNFFNVDNGIGYIINGDRFKGAAIIIESPIMLTHDQYYKYVHNFGYPSTGYKEVDVVWGFIKGILTTTIIPGLKGDMLNKEINMGVRLITNTEPTIPEEPFIENPIIPDDPIPDPTPATRIIQLNEFENDKTITAFTIPILEVKDYGFKNCNNLTYANLYQCTNVGDSGFYGCNKMKTIRFKNKVNFGPNAFFRCDKLEKVILEADTMSVFTNTTVPPFNQTAIFDGTKVIPQTGWIYVHDTLVEACKIAPGWSNYSTRIKGLSDL